MLLNLAAYLRLPLSKKAKNRRASVRHPGGLNLLGTASPGPSGDFDCSIDVQDISRGGIGLVLNHGLRANTALEVELHHLVRAHMETYAATVMHATPQEDGTWVIGCRFLQPLTEAQLKRWV